MINHTQLYLCLRHKPAQERFSEAIDQIMAIYYLAFAAAVGAIVLWLTL